MLSLWESEGILQELKDHLELVDQLKSQKNKNENQETEAKTLLSALNQGAVSLATIPQVGYKLRTFLSEIESLALCKETYTHWGPENIVKLKAALVDLKKKGTNPKYNFDNIDPLINAIR